MRFIPAVSPVRIQSPLPSPARCESISPVPFKGTLLRPVGQVVKTRPFHGCNMGSSPVRVTNGGLAQLVRAPASHAGGHWFESSSLHQAKKSTQQGGLFCFMWDFREKQRFDPRRPPKKTSRQAMDFGLVEYLRARQRAATRQSPPNPPEALDRSSKNGQ